MSIIDAARDAFDRLLLLDECEITRQGERVFDPVSGTSTATESEVGSGLACNLTPYTGVGALDEAFGGETVSTRGYRLTLRWNAPAVKREDIVTMTDSRDPRMIGRQFRVIHEETETFQSGRRLVVEAMDASEESSS